MEKTMADVVFEKGQETGEKKGRLEDIKMILEERFGKLSEALSRKIKGLDSLEKIEKLIRLSVKCKSLDEFEKQI